MRIHPGAALVLALSSLLPAPSDVAAQSADQLAAQCAAAGGDAAVCARGAGAARDIAGYVALLTGPGSAVSGQASTLGRRLGGTPRFAVSLRAAGVSVVMPDLADAANAREASKFVPTVDLTLALGAFEGLSVLPTVGGVFSMDILVSGSFARMPLDQGFDAPLSAASIGARLGLLRESFTLPAVTLSATRRFSGEVMFGDVFSGDRGYVLVDPGVTSFRAVVGKDLFAFGVLAGVGWDDVSSETSVAATNGSGSFILNLADVDASRRTYFLGLSKQLGVLSWISGELGWMQGYEPVTGGGASSPDPGRQMYGSVALVFRL